MAIAWLTGNQLSTGSTDLNTAGSATALQYNLSQNIDTNYFSYDSAQPTRLVITQPGDYLISAGLPMTSNASNTANRNDITQEIRLNGTLLPGGYSDSSYIRNTGGANESSNRSTTVVLGAQAGDYIEHYVYRGSTETTNVVTDDGHSLYVEYMTDKNVFIARATGNTSGTNLNPTSEDELTWTAVDRIDDGYTHDGVGSPENIILNEPGTYSVYCNIPLSTTLQRGNITARVQLDGVQVDGGQFQQGMVRNADGITTGSCHYAGVVITTQPNQVLSISTEQEAVSGTITVGSYYANIIVRRITWDTGVYIATATQVNNASDWNPSTKQAINWATDLALDSEYYTHDTATNNQNITIAKDGDYYLTFNVAFTGTVTRANPKATVQVNGADVVGLQGKSGYLRNTSGADSSSDIIVGFMPGLHAGDVLTVSMEASATTGTVSASTPAILMLRGKNIPIAFFYGFM